MNINKKIVIITFVMALLVCNFYLLIRVNDLKITIELERRQYAELYAKRLEYQIDLTKSSIETVTQETNLYMNLNEQLQSEYDALQKDIDILLKSDECGNSNIADNVRRRLFTN